jgi:predicted small integral membrane protein
MNNSLAISRLAKIVPLACLAFMLLLIAVNNVTDYGSNLAFVQHVLSMDTLSVDLPLKWRAIRSPGVHHVFYAGIILWEFAAGSLCALGAIQCLRALRSDRNAFAAARNPALLGLALSVALWVLAFLAVGGEWFAMWMSPSWNGQNAAARMLLVTALPLILLVTPEENGAS